MTKKEREELEYRRELKTLERAQKQAFDAELKAISNQQVDFLCDFYNLQIEPRIESSILYPDLVEISKSTKGLLNQRDLRRIKRFLRKAFRKDTILLFETDIENKKWDLEQNIIEQKHLEQAVDELHWYRSRELSEWLPDDKLKAWRKSSDFNEFITHYLMIRRTIDDLLQNRFHIQSKQWLENLEHQFHPPSKSILKTFITETVKAVVEDSTIKGTRRFKDISTRWVQPKNIESDPDGYYNLNALTFRWTYDRPVSIDWCGLNIKFLGESFLDGVYQILIGATQVRQCALDNCEKIARFPASGRGGRNKIYCSRNCTQKASNRKKEKI